jgi:hypothetical protein
MWAKGWACGVAFLSCAVGSVDSEDARLGYPAMAPLSQYLSKNAADEVALAKSAAPASISAHADVLTLTSDGYKTATKGNNGFVCLVERSWATGFADVEFWNPKFRAPTCYNPAAARTVLPGYLERTGWVLKRVSISEMTARTRAELSAGTYLLPEAGAMSYMMSKQAHLHDADGHWHPHVMFYLAHTDAAAWGANLDGSPIFAYRTATFAQEGNREPVTTFVIPVTTWSDGTPEIMKAHYLAELVL